MSLPLEVSKLVYAAYNVFGWREVVLFSEYSTVRMLDITYNVGKFNRVTGTNRNKALVSHL